MRISCSSCVFDKLSIGQAIHRIAELGFDSTDVIMVENWMHLNPSQPAAGDRTQADEFVAAVSATGLEITSTQVREKAKAAMQLGLWVMTGILLMTGALAHGQGELLLASGFEPPVRITDGMRTIAGADRELDWSSNPAWIKGAHFVYLVKGEKNVADFMSSSIVKTLGPKGTESHVLCMQNIADDPDVGSTSRNEFSFMVRKPPHDYRQGYVRYWMKLQADLPERLPNNRRTPWYMIMEWKEPNSGIKYSPEQARTAGGGPAGTNNYRINIGICRDAGAVDFHWLVRGEHPQPFRKQEWVYADSSVAVPFGEWFLVEAYMKKHSTEGRVYFAVNGQVVLDTNRTRPEGFVGRTEHADNPLPLTFWSPMKNYHGMQWNKQGPISQWYDDFELWTDFPPDHPAAHALMEPE